MPSIRLVSANKSFYFQDNKIETGTSVPSSGDYKKGDIIINIGENSSQTPMWICTNSGNPGTWENIGESYKIASTTENGLMSAVDKTKLDNIAEGANNYVHPGNGTNPHETTKSDIGLGSVNNWGASSATNDPSTTTYATTAGVKAAYDKALEAFQFANSGKTTIATAIGSPLVSTDTFSAMGTKINTLTSTFKTKLNNKGIATVASDNLNSLITKIDSIATSPFPKWYTGSNTWINATSMSLTRSGMAVSSIGTNIYSIGGNYNGNYTNVNECFDTNTGNWTTKTASPYTGISYSDVINNEIYLTNGYSLYVYNPTSNSWTTKASTVSGSSYVACASSGNNFFIIGGNGTSYKALNRCYDKLTDTWALKTQLSTGRREATACSIGNDVYCIGGYDSGSLYSTVAYNINSNTWTTKTSPSYPKYNAASTVNGTFIHYIGGLYSSSSYKDDHEYYSSTSNTWTSKTRIPTALHSLGACTVGKHVYITGGTYGSSSTSRTAQTKCYIL